MQGTKLLGVVGAMVIATTLGFVAGRMTNQTRTDQSAHSESPADHTNPRPARRDVDNSSTSGKSRLSNRHGSSQRDIKATMKHMVAELQRNPMLNMDLETMFNMWELARNFSEDEVRESLTYLDGVKNMQLKMTLQMMLVNRWGKINGPAAMEFAMNSENNQMRIMKVMGTLMSWTKEDPEAAFSWFEKNKENMSGGMYANAYEGIIYQAMARHDLQRILSHVEGMDNPRKKQTALTGIAQAVAGDPAKLESFLRFLEEKEPDSKKLVMTSVISHMAVTSPEDAKQYISKITDPKEKSEMINQYIQTMSYSDPESAIKWGIENAPDQKTQSQAVENALPNWALQNSKAAREWYDKQPAHRKSDSAVQQAANRLAISGQYEDAFAWIARGEDSEAMKITKSNTYTTWFKASPEDAKAWAEGDGKAIMSGIDLDALAKQAEAIETKRAPNHHHDHDH